jgi:RNA polymerase sigma-B factor
MRDDERERELFDRHRSGDPSARDELVEMFLPLARRLAGRYRNSGEPLDDLEQVASLGLINSIDRYDPDAGPFVRYAVPNIMGELKRHFRDKAWGVHVPRSLQERTLKVSRTIDELSSRLGRSPSPKDVAEATGFDLEEVLEAMDVSSAYSPAPLDAPAGSEPDGEGARTLADTLGEDDERLELVELGHTVGPALKALPEREQEILRLRFAEDLTQVEIAKRIGVSQMHVSRLLRRSLNRLSEVAEAD